MSLIGRTISPHGLRVFEVAARHLSFTAAARELRSTQSAVSQQVRGLEQQLGMALFERIYRGVRLTDAGQALFIAVQEGFGTIEHTLDRLQRQHRHPRLNILTDFALAAYWLMPRLPHFRQRYPSIDVRILTNQGIPDWQGHDIDVAIMFSDEHGLAGVPRLFVESVLPVCSPAFLGRHGPIDSLARLRAAPLLALMTDQGQAWLDWPSYFRQRGDMTYDQASELTFNNYTLLVQAALVGQGVALGWRGLIDDLLDSGALVGLDELALTTGQGYGVIDARPHETSEAKRAFMAWVLEGVEPPH